jgi:acetoin utilization deacetylase AcuC-like enzyme
MSELTTMAASLGTLLRRRIVSALAGGYNLDALGACAAAHLAPMLR